MMDLHAQVLTACRRLLSEGNLDPYSPAYGCFDRRFWGWKIADFPEATVQRNAYPLAWLLEHPDPRSSIQVELLTEVVLAALRFSACIQHRDGSFDQAFPHEHSFGATAFLLHSLLEAFRIIRDKAAAGDAPLVEGCLRRAADFLCRHDEQHGRISNHIAGAALSLLAAGDYFDEPRYKKRSHELIDRVLGSQSGEGWFPEYEGSDPGYQSLCLYYLAKIYRRRSETRLKRALKSAVEFLSWFVHPDGTFAGEYGSRRTAIFYPGGLALLANEIPLAESLLHFMTGAIAKGQTVTLNDVDVINIAPVLENYIAVMDVGAVKPNEKGLPLPCQRPTARQDFTEAGIYVRKTNRYYALFGASNGGVLKVFDCRQEKAIWNDGGYVGRTSAGDYLTTQVTNLYRRCRLTEKDVSVETEFCAMQRSSPTPLTFLLLRLMNLTAMRSIRLGNYLKKWIVTLLISAKREAPLNLRRTVAFGIDTVTVTDKINGRLAMHWLEFGRPFVAIHMASARYFQGAFGAAGWKPRRVDVETLRQHGAVEQRVEI